VTNVTSSVRSSCSPPWGESRTGVWTLSFTRSAMATGSVVPPVLRNTRDDTAESTPATVSSSSVPNPVVSMSKVIVVSYVIRPLQRHFPLTTAVGRFSSPKFAVRVQSAVLRGRRGGLPFEVDTEQRRQERSPVVRQPARVGVLASVLEQPVEAGLVATAESAGSPPTTLRWPAAHPGTSGSCAPSLSLPGTGRRPRIEQRIRGDRHRSAVSSDVRPDAVRVGVDGDAGVVGSTPTCAAQVANNCCQYANVVR